MVDADHAKSEESIDYWGPTPDFPPKTAQGSPRGPPNPRRRCYCSLPVRLKLPSVSFPLNEARGVSLRFL